MGSTDRAQGVGGLSAAEVCPLLRPGCLLRGPGAKVPAGARGSGDTTLLSSGGSSPFLPFTEPRDYSLGERALTFPSVREPVEDGPPHSMRPRQHQPHPHPDPGWYSWYRPPRAARAAPLHGDRGGGSATLACALWGLCEAFVNNNLQPLPFLPAAWNCVAV